MRTLVLHIQIYTHTPRHARDKMGSSITKWHPRSPNHAGFAGGQLRVPGLEKQLIRKYVWGPHTVPSYLGSQVLSESEKKDRRDVSVL